MERTIKDRTGIEDSENRVITQSELFENEGGPGVLQSSIEQRCMQLECQRQKSRGHWMCFDSVLVV